MYVDIKTKNKTTGVDSVQMTHILLNNIVLKLFGLRSGRHLLIEL